AGGFMAAWTIGYGFVQASTPSLIRRRVEGAHEPDGRTATGLDPACLRRQAEQPTTHDALFHTVLGLVDVTTTIHEPALDIGGACRR
ncbi:MAG: hypothetical protein KA132_09390, partial [Thauera sp.]|nr:hypothetical protein [Thauera sp.]